MATEILPRDLTISQVVGVLAPDLQADTMSVSALDDQAAADVYNDDTSRTLVRNQGWGDRGYGVR